MDSLEGLSATRLALRLARYGVTHVVATSDDFARPAHPVAPFPARSGASPPLTILALRPASGAAAAGQPGHRRRAGLPPG